MATKPIYIRGVPDDWHEAIAAEAEKKDGGNASALVRRVLGAYLRRCGHDLSDPVTSGGTRPGSGRKAKDS